VTSQPGLITVQRVAVERLRPLRASILRPDRPFEESFFPGDSDAASAHFAAFEDETMIGTASIFKEDHPDLPAHSQWRIRGMGVVPDHRNQGIGTRLLKACLEHAMLQGKASWCNSRISAITLYEKQGFRVEGQPFELPGIGSHVLMWREL
jgi:GNAT superfamily N-acetyltransferase